MRTLGWLILIAGTFLAARAVYLIAWHYGDMEAASQQRGGVLVLLGVLLVAFGGWLGTRRP